MSKNALLRSAQYRATFDAGITLALARQMVRGKLANMRVLLQRANRGVDDPAVAQAVDQLKTQLPQSRRPRTWTTCAAWRARAQPSILACSITC